jgi:crotonobetainyl-CoA:carnitine CoA-transferase CaiB-like acyl-CoA transferase
VSLDELLADPHLQASGLLGEEEHPTEGRVRTLGAPTRWSAPTAALAPAPRLGQHSAEVLRGVGLSGEQVAALSASGATR